jgi:rRNA small subunit pseudouridine methyltransferase Nep1
MSLHSTKLVDLVDFVPTVATKEPIVFVIGAFSHGKIDVDYIDEEIAVSSYALSGALVCAKVCSAFEKHWGVL